MVRISKYTKLPELTIEIVNELINKIVIQKPTGTKRNRIIQIDIYYNFIGKLNYEKNHPNGRLFHYLKSPVKKSTIACQICAKIFLLFSSVLLASNFKLMPEKVLPALETIESLSELKLDLKLALSIIEDLDKFKAKLTKRLI